MTHVYTPYVWSGNRPNWCEYIPGDTRTASSPSNIESETRSDNVNNPKDRYGFRAMSAFDASKHTLRWPSGESTGIRLRDCPGTVSYKVKNLANSGDIGYIRSACSDTSTMGMQTEQLMRQRAEANLARGDINVLQFAAFLPSTLRTLKQNADTLSTLLTNFRHINWQRELHHGGNARGLFLQYLFVHEQLLRDIRGGIKFLQQESGLKGQLVRGRSFNTSTRSVDTTGGLNYAWGVVGRVRYTGDVKVDQRAVAIARITCETTYTASQLGLTNPLYLGWDLVKYSWIIDQVVDIGGFIGSLSSTHGLEYLGTSVTTHSTNKGQLSVIGYQDKSTQVTPSFGTGNNDYKTVVRRVYDSPFNGITVRNPFRNNAMITAAAFAALSLELRQTRNIYTTVVNTLRKRGK